MATTEPTSLPKPHQNHVPHFPHAPNQDEYDEDLLNPSPSPRHANSTAGKELRFNIRAGNSKGDDRVSAMQLFGENGDHLKSSASDSHGNPTRFRGSSCSSVDSTCASASSFSSLQSSPRSACSSPRSPGSSFSVTSASTTFSSRFQRPSIKSGILIKEGERVKSWKKRFFLLDGFTLQYMKKMEGPAIKLIPVTEILQIIALNDYKNRANCFAVRTPPRVFVMQAPSEKERDEWIFILDAAVNRMKRKPNRE